MTGRGWSFGSAEEVARREQVHIPKYLDSSFSKFCNMIGQMCGFSWEIHVQLAFIAMGVSLVNKITCGLEWKTTISVTCSSGESNILVLTLNLSMQLQLPLAKLVRRLVQW